MRDDTTFRRIKCLPSNEQGVVALFAVLLPDLGFEIEHIGTTFPDCIAWRDNEEQRQKVAIEFEYLSSRFDHDVQGCDMVVCWEDDMELSGVEVLALREKLEELTGMSFPEPPSPSVEELMARASLRAELREVWAAIDARLREIPGVYTKASGWYVHYVIEGHHLCYTSFAAGRVRVDVFTGGQPLPGVGESKSLRFKPFLVRDRRGLRAVLAAIPECRSRLDEAVRKGEPTGY